MRTPLCPPCREASNAWLGYKLPTRPQFTNHAAYDDTAAGIRDRRNARTEEWKRTIRHAQSVIREACASGKHVEGTP